MTHYVITEGSYSDYHIIAVTADKDTAEVIAMKCGADIEEYEDGEEYYGENAYQITFDHAGNVTEVYEAELTGYEMIEAQSAPRCYKQGIYITVLADTKEEAMHKAVEKRKAFLVTSEYQNFLHYVKK